MITRLRLKGWSVLIMVVLLTGMTSADVPIVDAAKRGDTEAMRSLLEQNAGDVNAAYGDGMTALHWASMRGDAEMVRILIAARANVQVMTRIGSHTPLHLASEVGSAVVIGLLLEAGSEVNAAVTSSGATPLHFAAAAGNPEALGVLLDQGAAVNAREYAAGQTPLMFAAVNNRAAAIELLLKQGGDPAIATQVVDVRNRARVDAIARNRRGEVLRELEGTGGDGFPMAIQEAIRAMREVQSTLTDAPAIIVTDSYGVESDAADGYPTLVGSWGGLTGLLYAAREGQIEAAEALLDGGADVNQVSAGDHTSPLLMASINGQFDLAMVLIERGADPNVSSDAGTTPLYAVINTQWAPRSLFPQPREHERQEATYLEVMKALLAAGADPNTRLTLHPWYLEYTFVRLGVDLTGTTPFWRAAYGTDVEAMRLLIAYGADPNIPTAPQYPTHIPTELDFPAERPLAHPIHAVSGVGYAQGNAGNHHRHAPDGWLPSVKYLVEELGADPNLADSDGYTPLHYGAARGDNEFILYLVSMGADVTAVSELGQTTADMANGPRDFTRPWPETVALLESLGSRNNHNCVVC